MSMALRCNLAPGQLPSVAARVAATADVDRRSIRYRAPLYSPPSRPVSGRRAEVDRRAGEPRRRPPFEWTATQRDKRDVLSAAYGKVLLQITDVLPSDFLPDHVLAAGGHLARLFDVTAARHRTRVLVPTHLLVRWYDASVATTASRTCRSAKHRHCYNRFLSQGVGVHRRGFEGWSRRPDAFPASKVNLLSSTQSDGFIGSTISSTIGFPGFLHPSPFSSLRTPF